MTNRTSDAFICTVGNDETGMAAIAAVRSTTSKVNAKNKAAGNPERYRVLVRGRLGQDNPNRDLYRSGGRLHRYTSQDIRPEHSAHFDIYIVNRR